MSRKGTREEVPQALRVQNFQRDLKERLLEREKELCAMTMQLLQSVLTEERLIPAT